MGAILNAHHGTTVKDVPARDFIEAFAKHLKKGNRIKMPEWAVYYKTACFKDLAPYDPDWLYVTCLRRLSTLHERKGWSQHPQKTLRSQAKNGTCTEHSRLAAGKAIRYVLIELERASLVGKISFENEDGKNLVIGKALTKKGTTDMDRIASQIAKDAKAGRR